jgi:hypothetical protein
MSDEEEMWVELRQKKRAAPERRQKRKDYA